ncbi:hypothetical protein MKEN_00936400 [Mycena kentingensis (nom. inval.)]|nr:hypothetical protein MKEN_00936400 [Mycena kentingensis (nom. inval.)]
MASTTNELPDYVLNPDAVLKDNVQWRHKSAPNYAQTRADYLRTKKMTHEPGILASIVENLVKNWEIEASYKTELKEWRTIDHTPGAYSFAVNGGPPISAERMIELGTYNSLVAPNAYYSPEHNDFGQSHATFKRMMPTFSWEVLEVYSGPPQVAFRWRHWGEMKRDYSAINDKGERVKIPAHGKVIEIEGVTVAVVNDKMQLQKVETWFDPMEMFRQISSEAVGTTGGASVAAGGCPVGFTSSG